MYITSANLVGEQMTDRVHVHTSGCDLGNWIYQLQKNIYNHFLHAFYTFA